MGKTDDAALPDPEPERSGTMLESEDDIRQAILSGQKAKRLSAAGTEAIAPAEASEPAAAPFRPSARPPVAKLTVFDDGKADGEVIRIRDHRFIIGRTEGDLRIPLDGRISARHLEITYQAAAGSHRWIVTDLQSTHGMFVRVSRTVLADKAEFLVGNGRYRFEAPHVDEGPTLDHISGEPDFSATRPLDEGTTPYRPAAVTELVGNEIGNRIMLVRNEYWIGTEPSCPICRPDDPFCEPRHVRLYRSARGSWHAEHHKTPNGLWLRMAQLRVESVAQFQIGEQRFQLKVN